MATQGILSAYIEQALAQAQYDKLEDGTFAGRIPGRDLTDPELQSLGAAQ